MTKRDTMTHNNQQREGAAVKLLEWMDSVWWPPVKGGRMSSVGATCVAVLVLVGLMVLRFGWE